MTTVTHASVRQSILDAEDEFNRRMEHIEGFERAVRLMRSMERRRENILSRDQDDLEFFSLFDESKAQFMEMMRESTDDPSIEFDFKQWADEVEADTRNRCEEMISLATEGDDQFDSEWNRNDPETERMTTNPNSVKSFLHILQANGNLNESLDPAITSEKDKATYRWATYVAWSIAVVGMVIALSFLTADFYVARTNFAIHIERKNITVPYPAVTVCGPMPGLHFFAHFPTPQYPGRPLMGVSRLSLRDTGSDEMTEFNYPETAFPNATYIEEVLSGPNRESCRGMKRETSVATAQSSFLTIGDFFNVKKLTTKGQVGEFMPDSCYWCIRIGGENSIIAPNRNLENSGIASPPYHLALFQSKLFVVCRDLHSFRNVVNRELIGEALKEHASKLQERGILDFADFPPGNPRYDPLALISYGFNHTDRYDQGDYYKATSFACNVYFYSGYFYPTEGNPDIRYRFEISNRSWVETGRGPYYELGDFPTDTPDFIGPDFSSQVDQDIYSTNNMNVFIEDPDQITRGSKFVPADKKVYHAVGGAQAFFSVNRFKQLGNVQYRIDIHDIGSGSTRAIDGKFEKGINILMAYRTAATEEISSVATVGWSQYITDVFEFIGLFTGVCVFTLIVAPASSIARAGT